MIDDLATTTPAQTYVMKGHGNNHKKKGDDIGDDVMKKGDQKDSNMIIQ